MKKAFYIFTIIMMSVICVAAMTACTDPEALPKAIYIDIDSFDEAGFIAEMAREKDILLAENGHSEYSIHIAKNESDIISDVEFMRDALRQMTAAESAFDIVYEAKSGKKYIHIGTGGTEGVENDGYRLSFDADGSIYIDALNADGLANGIYCFLEDKLGCMFVRHDFSYIPSLPVVYLDATAVTDNPDFRWRRIYQYEVTHNSDWAKRLKSNGTGEIVEVGDGTNSGNRYWGTWCHSVYTYVDPDIYFESHPEYFALIDGERRYEYDGTPTALCLTNPEIYPIIENRMRELMAEHPEALYWDISINDSYYVCECASCTASYEKYSSHMGAMLNIVNRLAAAFPDKYISTLAYFYNNIVPVGIECADNVNIVIAPIGTSQLYPAATGLNAASAECKRMVEEWSSVAKNIIIWDYVINFDHLLLPYPNYSVQKTNLEFYKENNVFGVFHQGSREHTNEQADIRSYILSKQLWDIDADIEKLLAKYIAVTYGEAAGHVAEYLNIMHESVTRANDLDLYDQPAWHYFDYLSPSNLARYDKLTESAIEAVAADPQRTDFIKELRLNVLYARMTQGGFNIRDKAEAFEEFIPLVKELGVERPYEIAPPYMDEFINETYPEYLSLQKLWVSLITIGAVILPFGIVAGILAIKKFCGGVSRRASAA